MTVEEYKYFKNNGSLVNHPDWKGKILVDEVDKVLHKLLGAKVEIATYTPDSLKENNDKTILEDKIQKAWRVIADRIGSMDKEEYLKTEIRLLTGINNIYLDNIFDACKRVSEIFGGEYLWYLEQIKNKLLELEAIKFNSYQEKKHMENYYSKLYERVNDREKIDWRKEYLFISSNLNPEITDINIIVPNKVVEVTFADGLKEKMVCHKDDTFNLRNCLFIAIVKHLYKDEYTFEGIEWKAFELMHLKKYVKIVDSALKAFDKKQNNIARLEENRKAELESIERKRAKRQVYKERRAAKRELAEKERQIEIQKEAYIQAMRFVEDNKGV